MGKYSTPPERRRKWGNWGQRPLIRCTGLPNAPCTRMILSHPNGQRKRCAGCQLADLASRATRKRSKQVRPGCADCAGERPPETRSPRCQPCREQHEREVKNRSARERRAWAQES